MNNAGTMTLADLTVKEVAERLGLSTRTILILIKRGTFPNARRRNPFATKGTPWLIPEEDVDQALKELDND